MALAASTRQDGRKSVLPPGGVPRLSPLLTPPCSRWVVTMSGSIHLHRLSPQSGPEKHSAVIHGVTEGLMQKGDYIWVPHRPEGHTGLLTEVVSSSPIIPSPSPWGVTVSWQRVVSGTGAETSFPVSQVVMLWLSTSRTGPTAW